MTQSATGRNMRGAFIAVTSLFFMWGFITVLVDALIPRLKDVFELTFLQAGLVQFAWFAAYGLLSIPGGNLISRMGYQRAYWWAWRRQGWGVVVYPQRPHGCIRCSCWRCLWWQEASPFSRWPPILTSVFSAGGVGVVSSQLVAGLQLLWNDPGTVVAASFLLGDEILGARPFNP